MRIYGWERFTIAADSAPRRFSSTMPFSLWIAIRTSRLRPKNSNASHISDDSRNAAIRSLQALVKITLKRIDRNAVLQHRVSMPHGHLAVFERLMVNRDTEGRTDLILAGITCPDVAAVVEQRP